MSSEITISELICVDLKEKKRRFLFGKLGSIYGGIFWVKNGLYIYNIN